MKPLRVLSLLLVAAAAAFAQSEAPSETLSYHINWPSGLSLGEGRITARKLDTGFEYRMTLEGGIPGVLVRDEYTSRVNAAGCSLEFLKESTHGTRKTSEKSTFDLERGVVVRHTLPSGGKSETPITGCAHDALAYLFFLRKELQLGRLPPAGSVYFGGPYQVKHSYGGTQQITTEGSRMEADRLAMSAKGAASDNTFEIYFARDAARTPVRVMVPFPLGTFSLELVR